MSKGSSFFTFVAGVAAGAALMVLARTEKGRSVVSRIEKAGGKVLDAGCEAIVSGINAIEEIMDEKEECLEEEESLEEESLDEEE